MPGKGIIMTKPTKATPLTLDELEKLYTMFQSNVYPSMVEVLAEELGVTITSINNLGVGYDYIEECWVFAERDEHGQIIGLPRRYRDGSKSMVPGSKRGLTYECLQTIEKGRVYYSGGFLRVSSNTGMDCPICHKSDWCMVSSDITKSPYNPSAAICGRTPQGAVKYIEGSGYLHRLHTDRSQVGHDTTVLPGSDKPYIVVEGTSDVLAAMDLGYVGVGRPSAESGSNLAAALLRGKSVVIIGENDAGAGVRGMNRAFTQLKAGCKELSKCLPPTTFKDLRQWKPTPEEFASWIKQEGEKCDKEKLLYGTLDYIMLADKFVDNNGYGADGKHRLLNHHDEWWVYKDGKYDPIDQSLLEAQIAETFHGFEYHDDVTDKVKPVTINNYFIKEALSAIRRKTLSKVPNTVLEPCLINTGKSFNNTQVIVFRNGILDVMKNELSMHSNNMFTTATLPYDYDVNAKCNLWDTVVDQWLEEDEERIALLQEWFGYNMIMSNHLEQLMFIYGESGSGKSTAVNILQHLLGDNTMPATVHSLTDDQFGLAPLIGKFACMISEEDTVSITQAKKLLTVMKRITGNDTVSIRRMRKESVSGNLFCKITYFSNSLPTFHDETQSMFRRYNLLQFRESFAGTIDQGLTPKLRKERQGIAVWAVEGLKRLLKNNGKFTLPALSEAEIIEVKIESNPVRHMLETCLDWHAGLSVSLPQLYELYLGICEEEYVKNPIGLRRFRRVCCEASSKFSKTPFGCVGKERGWHGMGIKDMKKKKYLGK